MIVSNPTLISDLQYYIHDFVVNSSVNRYAIPLPVSINVLFLQEGSIVELLSKETFPYSEYKYLYENVSSKGSWPALTMQRLMIYPNSRYFIPSDSGQNIFNLKEHDFILLDTLLQYRHNPESVTITDSTSVELIIDTITNTSILHANFNFLNTVLSKLIFLYLELKIYGRYENYNNLNVISTCTLLETYFELRLIDEYFEYITNRDITFDIIC